MPDIIAVCERRHEKFAPAHAAHGPHVLPDDWRSLRERTRGGSIRHNQFTASKAARRATRGPAGLTRTSTLRSLTVASSIITMAISSSVRSLWERLDGMEGNQRA